MNEWAKALQEHLQSELKADIIPEGWLTAELLGKIWNRSLSATYRNIRGMMRSGKLKRKKFRIISNNLVVQSNHYCLCKNEPNESSKSKRAPKKI